MTESKSTSPGGAWTDEAVTSGRGDSLGRLPYARRAADLIESTHSFESSAVFGLSGPWGSGKTSLVNMIVEALQDAYPVWAVARFTPWATSDVSGLLAEFYASLAEALPKRRGRQVRKALATTAAVAAPAARLIPVAGSAAADGLRLAHEALIKSPSWQSAFSEASAQLKKLGTPILVVVDDIDRLHVDELMALLKVVRLLGRFDGVQYLLAYDDDTLHSGMANASVVGSQAGAAERFMEKIVQYPLFVPPLLRHQQLARLNRGLAGVERQRREAGAGSERRLGGLADCFTELLSTPRSIDRYVAQLRHHIPLLPADEVDDEDVMLLTLIRVNFPALFTSIPRFRSQLLSGHTGEIAKGTPSFEYVSFDINPLLEVVPPEGRAAARQLLISLFPKVRAQGQLSTYGSRRRQSVQHEEYFDRYFAMGILDHDVSDETVAIAVAAASDGNPGRLRSLIIGVTDDFRGLVLGKCLYPSNQPSTDDRRLQLAAVLADTANALPSDDSMPFGAQDQVLTWMAGLFVGLASTTPASSIRAVLWEFDGPVLRIRCWSRLQHVLDGAHKVPKPPWHDDLLNELLADAQSDFLMHLRQGDAAPTGSGVGYQVNFVLRHRAEQLRESVQHLIASGECDISVLASRLTGARSTVGTTPDWQLSPDFDQETFDQLAPSGDDPWYKEPIVEVDTHDLSWANRRKFVAGRVNPPHPSEVEGPTS